MTRRNIAVSYTHLVGPKSSRMATAFSGVRWWKASCFFRMARISPMRLPDVLSLIVRSATRMNSLNAVSYTHLQTLSRLNRCYPGKRTCVVDFTNEASTIQASFSDYYGAATIDSVTDPNVVYDLKTRLDSFDVYREREIDAVSDEWFV